MFIARAESNINTQLDFNSLPTPGFATPGFTSGFATPGFQTSLGTMTPGNASVYVCQLLFTIYDGFRLTWIGYD